MSERPDLRLLGAAFYAEQVERVRLIGQSERILARRAWKSRYFGRSGRPSEGSTVTQAEPPQNRYKERNDCAASHGA